MWKYDIIMIIGTTVEIRFCRWTSFSVFIPGAKYGGTLYLYGDVICTFSHWIKLSIYLSIYRVGR